MSQRVQAVAGERNVVLPDGWALDGGDIVVVTDESWAAIRLDSALLSRINDLGFTAEIADPVPTWRDIQQATKVSATGLEGQVTTLNAALAAHVADTTAVHGIADTSKLAWAQSVNVAGAADQDALRWNAATGTWLPKPVATGTGYFATINVASPLTIWTLTHNRNSYAIHVETFTNDDEPIEGNVRYPSLNVIEVDFYFPQAGYARLWAN